MEAVKSSGYRDGLRGLSPLGHEAGEVGPNYALLYNIIALQTVPEVSMLLPLMMMAGYSYRFGETFLESVGMPAAMQQKQLESMQKSYRSSDSLSERKAMKAPKPEQDLKGQPQHNRVPGKH
ncbi:hypothetical protein [Candidatus Synchoanobacter obligatus]|uniref:Uncharacterized protein n=1 Tax=Candidatus Synchoanobacter obligatus TaxID=2919597 RepID=A0ABT1L4U0_9GAMM|nr:hypothetical protein [Candidatus Synchoanobacter obligatus]MCP8352114.1 hypothetical protein [Candidatus Synchoanobacter obligatus]